MTTKLSGVEHRNVGLELLVEAALQGLRYLQALVIRVHHHSLSRLSRFSRGSH